MSPIYSPGAQSSEVRWPAQSHTVVVLGSRSIPGLQVLPRLCVPADSKSSARALVPQHLLGLWRDEESIT